MDPFFTTTFQANFEKKYTINIFKVDTPSVPSPSSFDIKYDDFILSSQGSDDRKFLDRIKTGTFDFTILVDNPTTEVLINDLKTATEGNYYVEVRSANQWILGSRRLYFGRIINQGSQHTDDTIYFYRVKSIDGITLLKKIDYKLADHNYSVKNILLTILKKIDVVDKFYGATDQLLYFASNLIAEDQNAGIKIENDLTLQYFFEKDDGYYSYFDVLEVILQILNARIYYENGIYFVRGFETYFDSFTWTIYQKNGSEAVQIVPSNTKTLSSSTFNKMENGVIYNFGSGAKSFQVVPDLAKLNDNAAYDKKWDSVNYGTFLNIGTIIDNKAFACKLFLSTEYFGTGSTVPSNTVYLQFTINLKFTGTSTLEYNQALTFEWGFGSDIPVTLNPTSGAILLQIPFSQGANQFEFLLKMPTSATPKAVDMAISFGGYLDENKVFIAAGGNFTEWQALATFSTYPKKKINKLTYKAVNTTENVISDSLSILWVNNKAQQGYQLKLGDKFSNAKFKYKTNDLFEPLEFAFIRNVLRINSETIEYLNGLYIYDQLDAEYPQLSDNLIYRGVNYIASKIENNLGTGDISLTMIKKPTLESNITIEILQEEETVKTNLGTVSQDYNGYFRRFTGTGATLQVSGITFPSNLIATYTNNSINNAIRVYVGGVKYFVNNAGTLQYNDNWILNESTKTFTFKKDLTGLRIEVEIDLSRLQTSITS